MRWSKPMLCVIGIAWLSACSTTPSTLPTARVPPQACVAQCSPLPKPTDKSDRAIRVWEYDVIEAAGECIRTHRDCVEWVTKEQ